jgi:hypothetical protein
MAYSYLYFYHCHVQGGSGNREQFKQIWRFVMTLDIEQKKGDSDRLDGRVIVYALIDIDPSDLASMKHPIASMIHNGLLVAQGNFKEQSSLKDFLKSEMGVSLEEGLGEGLAELLERMDGSSLHLTSEIKGTSREYGRDGGVYSTPAKIVPFHSRKRSCARKGIFSLLEFLRT